jgi:hypothetical protein
MTERISKVSDGAVNKKSYLVPVCWENIVHTEAVNAALKLVQEETGDNNNNAMEFALKLLHRHFEELEGPNHHHEVLRSLFQEVNVDSQRMDSFFQIPEARRQLATRNGRLA